MTSILPLTLTKAVVRRRGKMIVGPVTAEIGADGFTVVMGPNGAGKTTLLRLMHGLERPREGTVKWRMKNAEARMKQAFVFQAPIVMRRSVLDNIAYPLMVHGTPKARARERAAVWVETIGLSRAAGLDASFLSGGEKQKLAIARALIAQPDVLFLDEPTTNLDGRSMREIETILKAAFDSGTRIVMTTHNIGQARRLATEIMFLYQGLVHERSSAKSFFGTAETQEAQAYLKGDIVE